jgi:membrane fusion protein, multidrug efflux system
MKKIFILSVLAFTLILSSCGGKQETDNAQLETDISPVIPKINSTVVKVLVDDNQVVKMGDTLVILDNANYKIAVKQAEVALLLAKQNVKLSSSSQSAANSGVSSVAANGYAANAGVEAAKVRLELANKNYIRFKNLLDEKSVTQQQFDGIKAEKETAEKLLKVSEGQVLALQKQIASTQAGASTSAESVGLAQIGVKQAENNLEAAKLQLSYCAVLAPADGVVSKKNVQNGQVVAIGQPLMAITNNNKIWVVANFKETQVEKMKVGQEVEIEIDAFDGQTLKGKVASFAQATGSKFSLLPADNATGNFVKVTQRIPVKIVFTDKNSDTNLRAGMSATVSVTTE